MKNGIVPKGQKRSYEDAGGDDSCCSDGPCGLSTPDKTVTYLNEVQDSYYDGLDQGLKEGFEMASFNQSLTEFATDQAKQRDTIFEEGFDAGVEFERSGLNAFNKYFGDGEGYFDEPGVGCDELYSDESSDDEYDYDMNRPEGMYDSIYDYDEDAFIDELERELFVKKVAIVTGLTAVIAIVSGLAFLKFRK